MRQETPLFFIDSRIYASKVQEAEAQLAIDRANLKAAQKKYTRFHSLAEKDLIAQTEWDDLEAQTEKTQAGVSMDEARLANARLDLEKCTVRSPIDGRVGKIDVHVGHLIEGSGSTLTTVAQMDPLVVEFAVTEKEFPQFPKEQIPFEMSTLCSEGTCRSGKVTFVDNAFDSKTGLIVIRGKVENPDYSIRPGQSVRVKLPLSVIPGAVIIPQKAIRYNQTGPYIYVVKDDNTVEVRQITLGLEQGLDQQVLEGLKPEERIILEGHLRLSPGAKVEVQS